VNRDKLHKSESLKYPLLSSLDKELQALCDKNSMNDLDVRKRFLMCVILEEILQSLLPGVLVIPFGSSLNGFGWWTTDLHMIVCLPKSQNNIHPHSFTPLNQKFNTDKEVCQKLLGLVSSILEVIPNTTVLKNKRKSKAACVRFKQSYLGLECEIRIGAENDMAISMTHLMYLVSNSDPRVKPLFAGIKEWALVKKIMGGGKENEKTALGLLHLMVYYLQTVHPPVLPTVREMQALKDQIKSDLHSPNTHKLPSLPSQLPISENSQSVESLLQGFFSLFSKMNCEDSAISIMDGTKFCKPSNGSPLYVQNPFSETENVCESVRQGPLNHLQNVMEETAYRIKILPKLICEAQKDKHSHLSVMLNIAPHLQDHLI